MKFTRVETLLVKPRYLFLKLVELGFTAIKTGVSSGTGRPARIVETAGFVDGVVETFAAMREAGGKEVDIAIDFHGAISPQTAMLLIKALEPHQPFFIEEPIQCQERGGNGRDRPQDPPADRHRRAHLHQVGVPRDTGETGGDHSAARPVSSRRHLRGAAHRRYGRELLRRRGRLVSAATGWSSTGRKGRA